MQRSTRREGGCEKITKRMDQANEDERRMDELIEVDGGGYSRRTEGKKGEVASVVAGVVENSHRCNEEEIQNEEGVHRRTKVLRNRIPGHGEGERANDVFLPEEGHC